MTRRPAAWLGSVLGIVLLLGGVLSGSVSLEAMLVAAWLENLSAGAATVLALLRAPGGRVPLSSNVQVSGIPVLTGPDGTRAIPSGCAAGSFAAHFGIFTVVHGVFLGVIVATAGSGPGSGLSGSALLVVVVAAVLRALRRVEPRRAIAQAYAGLVPLHVAVIALLATTVDLRGGSRQLGPALLVVALLIVGDLVRTRIGGRPGEAPATPPRRPSTVTGAASSPPPPPPPSPVPQPTPPPPPDRPPPRGPSSR